MADTTTDPDVMEVDSNDSTHMEKNGVSVEVEAGIKLNKIPPDLVEAMEDDSLSNSNHDMATEDLAMNESDNKEDIVDNASDSQEVAMVEPPDTTALETEESNGTNGDGSLAENHKESNNIADETNTDNEAAPAESESSIPSILSEKQLSTSETDSPKPSALQEILTEMCPKNSPEVIVANLSPFVKDRFEISDSAKAKVEKENESISKVDSTDNNVAVNSKEKENEAEPKEKSKSGKKKKSKVCAECGMKKKTPLRIVFHGQVNQLCSESCYKIFKEKMIVKAPVPKLLNENCAQCETKIDNSPGYLPSVGEVKALCSEECLEKYHEKHSKPKNCSQCKGKVESAYNRLTWETMVFCNEDCLGKYQSFLGSHCTCCQSPVQQTSLGKYCVCFGPDIRQFCSGSCLEEFKKGLKVCSFCQTDLSGGDGFLAPVGDKGQFKDFCSPRCMERYEVMNNLSKSVPDALECCNCKKQGAFKIQVKQGDKTYSLCSDICLSGFRCSYEIMDNLCGTCFKCVKSNENEVFTFTFEGFPKHFCTKACMTLFVLSNRKIIQCLHCKVKKYNFDMIERLDSNNQFQMFCSLNCLSLFRVNISATSNQKVRCDHCNLNIPAQYHLTMSDGSIRSFCNYECVVTFQKDCLISSVQTTSVTRLPITTGTKSTTINSSPVITSVSSLSQQPRPGSSPQGQGKPRILVTSQGTQPATLPQPLNKTQVSSSMVTSTSTLTVAPASAGGNLREIIVRPPAPKSLRNKSASCKPIMQTKGVCVKSQTCHKAVQTDDTRMPSILPVPFPVYLPSPVIMYTRTVSVPMPFPVPVPIPVPFFIKEKSSSKTSDSEMTNVESSAECMKMIEESQKKLSNLSRLGITTAEKSTLPVQKEPTNSTIEAPIETVPMEIAVEETAPYDTASIVPAPHDTASIVPAPKETVVIDTAPKENVLIDTAPKENASKDTAIKKAVPKETATKEKSSSETVPIVKAPKETVSNAKAQTETAPNETAPNVKAPTETAPKESAPTETAPKVSTPKETPPKEMAPKEKSSTEMAPTKITSTEIAPKVTVPKETPKSIPQASISSQNSIVQIAGPSTSWQDSQPTPMAVIAPKIEPMDEETPGVETKPRRKKRSGEDLIVNEGKKARAEDEDFEYAFGVNAWKKWVITKNALLSPKNKYKSDLLSMSKEELNSVLTVFVQEIKSVNGTPYSAGALFYLLLGIQLYLSDNKTEMGDLFSDKEYLSFADNFHNILMKYEIRAMRHECAWSRLKEEFLWDSRQLGAQSPQILLNTLIYFNTKFFKIRTVASHLDLNFRHIARHTDKQGSFLRYYKENNNSEAKYNKDDIGRENHLIQPENNDDQLRCPVRLFEFYISKCPPSCLENNSKFYCQVKEKITSDTWYSDTPLDENILVKSFQRTKLIEEADVIDFSTDLNA